jgi:ketosteroid isomerase-like protein
MKRETFSFGRFLPLLICLLVPACLLLPVIGRAQRPQHPPDRNRHHQYQKEVEALEVTWRNAMLRHDAPTIDGLLSDDYVAINSNGMLQTKQETLARLRSGAVVFKQLDTSEVKVSVHGETAVVTCRTQVVSTQYGVPHDGVYRYTRVYQHRGGAWKIVNFEATRINPLASEADPNAAPEGNTPPEAKK